MKRIVFIFHEATFTGAPLLLKSFLEYIRERKINWDIVVLFQKPGPLTENSPETNDWVVLNKDTGIRFPARLNTFLQKAGNRRKLKSIFKKNVDLIYSNTIVNGLLLQQIKRMTNAQILLHVHELSLIIKQFGSENQKANLQLADVFLFNSKLVADNWKKSYGLDKPFKIIYPFVTRMLPKGKKETEKNGFVVGGCGNLTWRKGVESFLFIAKEVNKRNKNVHFHWVGASQDSREFQRVNYLIDILNLREFVELYPSCQTPEDYFKNFDLLLVTSYEEPFSMVAAECASLGVPLVCWKGCTGAEELLVPNAGCAVEAGMHTAAADKIIELLADEKALLDMGRNAIIIADTYTEREKNCKEMVDFINMVVA